MFIGMVTMYYSLPSHLNLANTLEIGVMILEEQKGLIFDIQSYSVHDGPGCRSVVFLSGCPLHCEWCSNPEGIKLINRIMYSSQKCRNLKDGCVRCIEACPHSAIRVCEESDEILVFDRTLCEKCETYDCTKACFHEAIRLSGKWMTISELMGVLNRDRQYWSSEGGVTFSGGEALMQKDFLLAVLKKCRGSYIHTAIETTACAPTEVFLEAFKYIDFAFIDIKNMDSKKHKEKTGVGNELILKNIEALAVSNWQGRLIIRMPVIRDYNDSENNLMAIAKFMKKLGLFEINILPFHRLGDSKWTQLGMIYKYKYEKATSPETMDRIQDYFLEQRIACYKGHETPF